MAPCLTESDIEGLLTRGLGAEEAAAAEAHLAACSSCRQAVHARRADARLFQEIKNAFLDAGREHSLPPHPPLDSDGQPGLHPFETIEGYDLLAELHRGGQGVVYKATQRATKRTVALKVLLQGAFATPRQRGRFEREVDLVATLRHPNIVTIYDSGVSQGRPFYAMEYIEGAPLDRYVHGAVRAEADGLEARDSFVHDVEATLRLFQKICAAVSGAHQRGVIHRDLKPNNILIDADAEPHVLDFGLAKLADSNGADPHLTATGEFVGTLAYASPEQAKGDPQLIDVRTDVYSLGIILYEMLTGTFPYPVGGSVSEVLRHISEAEPRRPSSVRRDIDAEVETIVLKALAKEPERRYQSAEHLGRDVAHYLNGQPIDAKRDSTWYLLRKSLRRYWAAVATAAAFVVTIAVALVVSIALWGQAVQDREAAVRAEQAAKRAQAEESRQREEAEFQAYVANVAAAGAALRAFDVVEARRRLDQAAVRLRNWEWHELYARLNASLLTLTGHTAYVEAAAFSPDGRRVASASADKTVRVWDAKTGELVTTIQVSEQAWSVAFHPDGSRLAVGSFDGTVRVWDFGSGDFATTLHTAAPKVTCVAFDPAGQRLAAAFGLYDPGVAKGVVIWDLATERPLVTIPESDYVHAVAFSPDGSRIALRHKRGVTVWDVTGTEVASYADASWPGAVAYSPDGSRLAWAAGNAVRVWDAAAGTEIGQLEGHTQAVHAVAFSPDGRRVVTGSRDKTVRTWDATALSEQAVLCGHTWAVASVAFSPDGRRIASASWDRTVMLWNSADTGGIGMLGGHTAPVTAVAFGSNGRMIATASQDATVRIWDVARGRTLHVLAGHSKAVQGVAFSPDAAIVASASVDGRVNIWDTATGRELRSLDGHTERVHGAAFHPGRDLLVTGSRDNTLRLWDPATGDSLGVLTGHDDHIHCVAISPDGRWIGSSGHNSVKVWDASSGALHVSFPRQILQEDYSLAFHPDSRRIAAGSAIGKLTIWDVIDRQPLATLVGHTDEISSAAFSPDGSRLVSTSTDGTIKLWDVSSAREIATLKDYSGTANCICFSPDGSRLVAGMSDGTVRIWRARFP